MSLKIVVKQDDGKGNWAIYRADGIGAIEWPFKRKCKQHERPTEKQVRSIYNNLRDFLPIEYQDMNGNVLS
jgi:hypothetical protein